MGAARPSTVKAVGAPGPGGGVLFFDPPEQPGNPNTTRATMTTSHLPIGSEGAVVDVSGCYAGPLGRRAIRARRRAPRTRCAYESTMQSPKATCTAQS